MIGEGAAMRTFFAAAICSLALASPAGAASRNFGITSFEKIRVDGPFKVVLATGVAPFARVTGSTAAINRVAVDVRGNTLVVHNNIDSWGNYPDKDVGPVEVTLGTHDLSSAWLNGSGNLAINRVRGLTFDLSVQGSGAAEIADVEVDQLSVNVAGTGSTRLSGNSARLTAVVRGISGLEASSLAVKDATLGVDGAGTIRANVSNSVKLDASGPATVELAGRPSCTVRATGSATVSGCR